MILELNIIPSIYKRGPNIKIFHAGKTHDYEDFREDKIIMELNSAPTSFTIMHHGRTDADVNFQNGLVVQEVGFTLHSIKLDNHVLQNEIYKFPMHRYGKTETGHNYFGLNGYMTIDIDQDLDRWIWDIKHQFRDGDDNIDVDAFIKEVLS